MHNVPQLEHCSIILQKQSAREELEGTAPSSYECCVSMVYKQVCATPFHTNRYNQIREGEFDLLNPGPCSFVWCQGSSILVNEPVPSQRHDSALKFHLAASVQP